MGTLPWPQRLPLLMVTSSSSLLQLFPAALADAKIRDGAVRPWHFGCCCRRLLGSSCSAVLCQAKTRYESPAQLLVWLCRGEE